MGFAVRPGGGGFFHFKGRLALITVWNEREKTGQSNMADIAHIYIYLLLKKINDAVKAAGVCCLGDRLSCQVLRETQLYFSAINLHLNWVL